VRGGPLLQSSREAFALAYPGRLQQATRMSDHAVDQAQHTGQRERAGLWEAGAAVRDAFFDSEPGARRRALAALQRYIGQIQLPAGNSRAPRAESWLPAGGHQAVASRRSIRAGRDAQQHQWPVRSAVSGLCTPRGLSCRAPGPEGAAEFQKIPDHPRIIVSDPIGALAHLQLGRAFALAGDNAGAKAAYRDFSSRSGKMATPISRFSNRLKAEYAKLP
jgi:eukaryotic-like serine/threonine-protein kinase